MQVYEDEQELIAEIDDELIQVDTITPYEAGIIIRKNAEYIRALLRDRRVDWGTAVEGKTGQLIKDINLMRQKR